MNEKCLKYWANSAVFVIMICMVVVNCAFLMGGELSPKWTVFSFFMVLLSVPLGMYAFFVSRTIMASLRVGDLERSDKYAKKMRLCCKALGVYILLWVSYFAIMAIF